MSPPDSAALGKVLKVLGPVQGRALIEETKKKIGLASVTTPDECMRFGEALVRRGGLHEAIGRAIKIQALLNGASETAA